MCAEFTPGQPMEIEKLLEAAIVIRKIIQDEFWDLRIFPRGQAPILIRDDKGELDLVMAEFSLIPAWWNPAKPGVKATKTGRPAFATHNARLESISEKPTFRESFQNRHCLVPIRDFFESSLFGNRFPGHRIKISGGSLLLAAGCYSEWLDKSTGEIVTSFTIITHLPNKDIFEAGHDRMPVFLDREAGLEWLGNEKAPLPKLTDFLLKKSLSKKTKFSIEIDRVLKDGWQKNAPSEEELQSLSEALR